MLSARVFSGCVVAAALTVTSSACAGSAGPYRNPGSSRQIDQRSYERGYVEGHRLGALDVSRRRTFDYARHNVYRQADTGYRGRDAGASRTLFREGFIAGYRVGYNRQGSGVAQRRGGIIRPPLAGRSASPARQLGYRDGFEQGRTDRQDGDRYDPVRASRYRSGDRDYNSRYGVRADYQREYRAAFLQGYEQGYRGR
jgi:hypothetical protein